MSDETPILQLHDFTEEQEEQQACNEDLIEKLEIALSMARSGDYSEGMIVLMSDDGENHAMITSQSVCLSRQLSTLAHMQFSVQLEQFGVPQGIHED